MHNIRADLLCAAWDVRRNVNANNTEITCISLCSGYEGIGLGIKRVIPNLRVILYSEIEKYACEVLVQRMEEGKIDPAPIWTNLKTLPCDQFSGKVDIITGGYPCQPFSAAGARKGKEDPRHLWPFIKRAIESIRPAACFFENVEGHISLGLSTVLSDLEELGYETTFGLFSAAECLDSDFKQAPHQRKRVFIMAYAKGAGDISRAIKSKEENGEIGFGGEINWRSQNTNKRGKELAYTGSKGREKYIKPRGPHNQEMVTLQGKDVTGSRTEKWPARPGEPQYEWEEPRVI